MGEVEVVQSEHRAIVFKMTRKEAQALAKYIRDHSGDPEMIIAVDVDTDELILQSKNARETDNIMLQGEEDVFEVEEELEDEDSVEE